MPQTEVETTPESQALLAEFTLEEVETGIVKAPRPSRPEERLNLKGFLDTYREAGARDEARRRPA